VKLAQWNFALRTPAGIPQGELRTDQKMQTSKREFLKPI
jgi:hypothetical protein